MIIDYYICIEWIAEKQRKNSLLIKLSLYAVYHKIM